MEGAPERTVMPQTDGTDDLKANQDLWKNPLKAGEINILPKYGTGVQSNVKKESRMVMTFEKFVHNRKK